MSCCTTYRKIVSGEAGGLGAGLVRGALGVASIPYRWGSSLIEILRTGQGGLRVDLPVISIGNITAGGTGKTPFVAMVVRQLREKGLRPVVLSRGYKSKGDAPNDEAQALARSFPDLIHLQGKDRAELAWHASTARLGEAIVLDDGFQHHGLARDLDVCLVDATNPFGYGSVLPRGLLREPLTSFYRARPVVITRAELASDGEIAAIKAEVLRWNEHAKILVSRMELTRLTDMAGAATGTAADLRGKRVLLASGVGNPDAFARSIRRIGARVVGHVERGDHHAWTQADVAAMTAQAASSAAEMVVTTTKDAVKLQHLAWPDGNSPLSSPLETPLVAIEVEASIVEGKDVWDGLLAGALKSR